jgi:hypothetical protein
LGGTGIEFTLELLSDGDVMDSATGTGVGVSVEASDTEVLGVPE